MNQQVQSETQVFYPYATPPAPGDHIEVALGVLWIRMPLPFALDHINLWLLADNDGGTEGWTIVDTGYGDDITKSLWQTHFKTTMRGLPVKKIVVTHYHPDHVGCAGYLSELTGAPVYMTTSEFMAAHAAAFDFAGFDRERGKALFLAHGAPIGKKSENAPKDATAGVDDAQNTRAASFKRGVPQLPYTYRRLMDGDTLKIGAHDWKITTVFGHAPEHATLYSASLNVLISGDQVLPRITTNVGVWGNQPEANPLKAFLDSMSKLAFITETATVLPSHDRVFTGLHLRIAQLHAHHALRLDELHLALDAPKSAMEILPVLFRRKLDDHQLVFALGEAIAHLHMLYYAGKAERILGEDGVYRFLGR